MIATLGLVALGASGEDGEAAALATADEAARAEAPSSDAGLEEAAGAVAAADEDEGEAEAAEAGEAGEGSDGDGDQVADFPVPQFEDLAPIPEGVDWLARAVERDGKLVVEPQAAPIGPVDQVRTLTVDPRLQKKLTTLLKSYVVPYGAIAAIEPATGRVLALAEHSHDAPGMRGLPLKAVYPAASVFKLVTGSALLEAGVSPEKSVCFHGGKHRLSAKLLDDSKRDWRCNTLSEAMGFSFNVIFAKLADRELDARTLRATADRFGFNAPLEFDQPVDVSVARVPEERFELAKTAAGFGEVFLSPLHAAMIAGAVGNGGVMMSPVLFEGQQGQPRKVLEPATAKALGQMCELTVSEGTARKAFRERGRPVLGSIKAAGKTGSLHDKKPFRDFTWFVGWAPADKPTVAVAAVVVNGPLWRVHAPYLGREALRMFFEPAPVASKAGRARRSSRR